MSSFFSFFFLSNNWMFGPACAHLDKNMTCFGFFFGLAICLAYSFIVVFFKAFPLDSLGFVP